MASFRRAAATWLAQRSLVRRTGMAALVCVGATVAACGGDSSTGTSASSGGKPTQTLTIGSNIACFQGLDVTTGFPGGRDLLITYEPLIRFRPDQDGALAPALATSWKVAPGNRSMTMTLRKDARFSDGTPVTAQAVKTWLDYRNTITSSPFNAVMGGKLKSTEVLDRHTIKVTTTQPNPNLPNAFSTAGSANWGFVVNPRAIATLKKNPRSDVLKQRSAGAGQYVMVSSETVLGDHCTYVPNRYYYDQSQIKWGKIVTKTIPDPNTLLAAVKTGQVDIADGDSSTVAAARAAGLKVVYSPGRTQGVAFFDKGGRLNPALADVRVRRALNYAIDRKTIASSLFGPDAQATSNPNPTADGDDPATRDYYDYDPEKAKQLLAEAGYPNGFTLTMIAQGPWIGSFKTTPMAQAVASDLAKVGVTVKLTSSPNSGADSAALASKRFESRSYIYGTNPTWIWYSVFMAPGGYYGDQHGWVDPVIKRLWERGAQATPEEGAAIWKQIMNRAIDQAYFVPVLSPGFYIYVSRRVDGVDSNDDAQSGLPVTWAPASE